MVLPKVHNTAFPAQSRNYLNLAGLYMRGCSLVQAKLSLETLNVAKLIRKMAEDQADPEQPPVFPDLAAYEDKVLEEFEIFEKNELPDDLSLTIQNSPT